MSALMEGSSIGPYRVGKLLGEGGMGAVYEAEHVSVRRRVAIKILKAEYAQQADVKTRFNNEALAANTIEHPGIVQVFDRGLLEDGTAYLVMEFLSGETITDRMRKREGRIPEPEVVRIAHLVADSLTAAHAKGVIHRDLKPANVMIVTDPNVPGRERTKLLDFGIAKLAPSIEADHVRTNTNVQMGTVSYMSPEQCRGSRDLDSRSDVYSLGVVLYFMVTGKRPFTGESHAVMAQHLFEPPPPLPSSVSPELSSLVLRMLSKDKDARPSMEAVSEALRTMTAQPVEGRQATDQSNTRPVPIDETRPLRAKQNKSPSRDQTRLVLIGGAVGIGSLLLTISILLKSSHLQSDVAQERGINEMPQRIVHWRITSIPSGARVIRRLDGQQLCTTPCNREQHATHGSVEVQLLLSGHAEQILELEGDADEARTAMLTAVQQPPSIGTTPEPPKNPGVVKNPRGGLGTKATKSGIINARPKPEP